jgi:hypothetical protein
MDRDRGNGLSTKRIVLWAAVAAAIIAFALGFIIQQSDSADGAEVVDDSQSSA